MVIYLALMAYLVLVKLFLDLDLGSVAVVVPSQATIFGWPMIAFLTIVGTCSVWLGPKAGLPGLWEPNIGVRKRLLLPAVVGLGLGVVFLIVQAFTGFARVMAEAANVPSINVPFPASILFYSGGAIAVESLYRLILLTLPLWLIANVILRKQGQTTVFWAVAVPASVVEPLGQMSLVAGHPEVMAALGIGMYAMNIFEAILFRRYGFLAPMAYRLAYYFVWHVVGGGAMSL